MEYDNKNTGVLFRNAKKDLDNPEDKKPDYTGQAEIDGTEYWLSGWKRQAKESGNVFLSLAVQLKDNLKKSSKDDDLPF